MALLFLDWNCSLKLCHGESQAFIFTYFFIFTGCAETLISVSVFPDARYLMKIESQGDKRDIYDKDFVLPTSDRWNIIEDQRLDSDSESPIFLRSAESLLMGENL